jgi:hypothetical protein
MNDVVAKHQHVPVADSFLTGVAGRETRVVNLYPSGTVTVSFFAFWAFAGDATSTRARNDDNRYFILFRY